jgi:hypothetical protein
MNLTPLDIIAGIVIGTAAAAGGGYLAGNALAAKFIGRDLAGFLGMLYGPLAGTTGVIVGIVAIELIGPRS